MAQFRLLVTNHSAYHQVDAHADVNTPQTTDSGNLHGCPLSFLLGLSGTNVEPFNKWVQPCLKPSELSVPLFPALSDVT